ncbi:hypothetical protein PSYAC_20881, partial [Pseudomonas syringae pv. actinidiae str. M302091]
SDFETGGALVGGWVGGWVGGGWVSLLTKGPVQPMKIC